MNNVLSFPLTAAAGLAIGVVIAWSFSVAPQSQSETTPQITDPTTTDDAVSAPATSPAGMSTASSDAIQRCDINASHPDDPNRIEAAVDDKAIALGRALQSCGEAVAEAPTEPRLHFQLGRALWLAGRDHEAFNHFVEAASIGYAPAEMYIGHAYLEDRGLPCPPDNPEECELQSIHTALHWYEQSAAKGFPPAEDAVIEVKSYIRRNAFNPSEFQEPAFISRLYYGDFNNMDDSILFFSYAQGMFKMLDSEQAMDHAPECKPLLNKLGQIKIAIGQLTSYLDTAANSQDLLDGLFKIGGAAILGGLASDAGERDATQMINIHGCDSDVARSIVDNLIGLETVIEAQLSQLGHVAR